MKKLKLPQPYASMVAAGILQTIPNQWNDVKFGEKIFIYADDLAEEFSDGPDYSKAFHRKIFNEMFMGNLPDGDFPTQRFIGYVRVYHSGTIDPDWAKDGQQSIFVTLPYKLITNIEKFDCKDEILEQVPARRVYLKSIRKNGSHLYVPVCKNVWQRLHDMNECQGVCMFWESYMATFGTGCFSMDDTDIEEVEEVHFQYNNRTITFATDGGVGENIEPLYNKKGFVSLLSFNLQYLIDNYTLIELRVDNKPETDREDDYCDDIDDTDSEPSGREHRQYIRFISTPMGGMTRWKRR